VHSLAREIGVPFNKLLHYFIVYLFSHTRLWRSGYDSCILIHRFVFKTHPLQYLFSLILSKHVFNIDMVFVVYFPFIYSFFFFLFVCVCVCFVCFCFISLLHFRFTGSVCRTAFVRAAVVDGRIIRNKAQETRNRKKETKGKIKSTFVRNLYAAF
jgi:hypothetical protein